MAVISLSLDHTLLDRFDKVWEQEGYNNRSEAMRSAMRDFIHNYKLPDPIEDEIVETIIVFSYHDSKQIRSKLGTIQHNHQQIIKETLHRHVSEDICFEMFTVTGKKVNINPLVGKIRSVRGIESFHTFSVLLDHQHHEH